jgi:hypothetical protein
MAFKSKVTPNIGTSGAPSTVTDVVSSGTVQTIIGLSLANTVSTTITVSVKTNKSGGSSSFIVKDAAVLPGGTLVAVGGDQKIVLESGDTITAYASAGTSADVIVSYLLGNV